MNFAFASVLEGGTQNVLNVPEYPGNISSISNLGYGDVINAGGANLALVLNPDHTTYTLHATEPGGATISSHVTLEPGVSASDFEMSGGNFIFDGPFPCFCAGTRILTDHGEVLVEDLKVCDLVVTASGEARAVRWLGHRRGRCDFHPNPQAVWPICVARGAFGNDLPTRDLWLSHGHSIAVDGVLIPVGFLRNGRTITQHERGTVDYWHVELDRHDVILAEGLTVESYLDVGNRTNFANGGVFLKLHPDFEQKHWSETCLPLVLEGAEIVQAKRALLARAKTLGHRMTSEPDLHIVADGQRVDAVRLGERRYLFVLPPNCEVVALCSRSFVPAYTIATSSDQRSLGVSVNRLQIDGAEVSLDSVLGKGWHNLERNAAGLMWRWTDGATPLPAKTRAVLVDLGGPGCYWAECKQPALSIVA